MSDHFFSETSGSINPDTCGATVTMKVAVPVGCVGVIMRASGIYTEVYCIVKLEGSRETVGPCCVTGDSFREPFRIC